MIYFIADTHFGHQAIMGYESRPFSSVEEMDRQLIKNWNEVVTGEDTVFVLGDFSAYDKEKTTRICQQLVGKKILVKGNHDTESEAYYRECGFSSVYDYPIILENFWILSHEPMYLNGNMPYANIYGHVHGSEQYVDYSAHSFCACVERIQYRPIAWDEVKRKMAEIKA